MTDKPIPSAARRNMSAPGAGRQPFTMPEATLPDPPSAAAAPAAAEPAAQSPSASPRSAPRFTIHAVLNDFPFEVSFDGSADVLASTVKRLREIGAVPPSAQARQAVAEEAAREAPRCTNGQCDHYGKPMKPSTKAPGTFYCSGKTGFANGQVVYCKEKG